MFVPLQMLIFYCFVPYFLPNMYIHEARLVVRCLAYMVNRYDKYSKQNAWNIYQV